MTPSTTVSSGDALRHDILRRIAPVVRAAGVHDHEIECQLEGLNDDLHVVLHGPAACQPVRQAIGVRVLDAVRADGRTFGAVTVDTRFGGGDDRRGRT